MTDLPDSYDVYLWLRSAQIMLAALALLQTARYGAKAFGRLFESVAVMLAALLGMSVLEVAHSTEHEARALHYAWITFDAVLAVLVLRAISEHKRLARRPRLGSRGGIR